MKQAQEGTAIMDNGITTVNYLPSSKVKQGLFVTRRLGYIIVSIFLLSLVMTGVLVYKLTHCTHTVTAQIKRNDIDITILNDTVRVIKPLTTQTIFNFDNTTPLNRASTSKYIDEPRDRKLNDIRLPKSIHPMSYTIKLTPYLDDSNFTFDGDATIVIKIDENCNNITIHSVDLKIKSINLTELSSRNEIKIAKIDEDEGRQFLILHTAKTLNKGEYLLLHLNYTGFINDDLRGFYRSSYVIGNETRWIAVTQFQPTDARRAFPCFDEPAFKASFTISIARPNRMNSISNMNRKTSELHSTLSNYTWDHFATSLPMSTYLVAFAVTDFVSMSDGIFTVWARENAIKSAAFALEIGPKMLKFCEDFYKIPFPLPKIDMIAVPDFSAGAMENWGLLAFRETAMLYSKDQSPISAQMRVAAVVAHELAHQWFGNLVTPTWWSDLWLNEGFSSYVEYIAVNAVEKSWKSLEQFVINDIQGVFLLDALESSHQISVEVSNPEEINEIFDSISYGKGSAIIRMMNHFLTEKVFNLGITDYLMSKKFANAEQKDLWDALTKTAREVASFPDEVGQVMDAWTLQTGFPVVTVTRNYDTGSLHFEQERFKLLSGEKNNQTWWVPISYTSAREKDFDDTYPKLWMKGVKEVTLENASLNSDDWIIVNIQQTGFYRVNYDERNWELITKTLNDPTTLEDIAPINRAQVIDDVMNLAHSGKIDYKIALGVNKYLRYETNYVPWKSGLVSITFLDAVLSKTPFYLEYKKHAISLLEGTIKAIGWESTDQKETMIRIQHRAHLLSAACHLEHPDCMSYAVQKFHMWMMSPNPDLLNEVPVDMRSAVYCAGLSAGGEREWSFAWERFLRVAEPSERDLLLNVLGCTREPYLLHRYLHLALKNNSSIRKQDVVSVFASLSNSVIGQPIALSFLRQNCRKIKSQFGLTFLNIAVKVVGKRLSSDDELEELYKLETECKHDLGRSIIQVIEMTKANIIWKERNLATIVDWLKKNQKHINNNHRRTKH